MIDVSTTAPFPDEDSPRLPPGENVSGDFRNPAGIAFDEQLPLPDFPIGDLLTGNTLLTSLGAFWSIHFADRDVLSSMLRADSIRAAQSYVDYVESVASTSRFNVPVLHRHVWYLIVVSESQMEIGPDSLLRFDGAALFDSTYRYGYPVAGQFNAVETNLVRVGVIANRLVAPSACLVSGIDFSVDDEGTLQMSVNPFEDGRFAVRNVYDDAGNQVDRSVSLWAFGAYEDWSHIYQHFGYALRRRADSSISYRNVVNAFWNGLAGCLSSSDLEWFVASVAGLPVSLEQTETVELISPSASKLVIVTNHHAYRYPAGSTPAVSVGEVVRAGTVLVDTVRLFDLADYNDVVELLTATVARYTGTGSSSSSGGAPAAYIGYREPSRLFVPLGEQPLVPLLVVNRGIIDREYSGSLIFHNVRSTIDLSETDDDGNMVGRIAHVDGAEVDLYRLWHTAHQNGLAAPPVWYNRFDGGRPATINPAGFLVEQFLSNNCLVAYLRYDLFGDDADTGFLPLLRRVVPPEKTILYLILLEAEDGALIRLCDDGSLSSSSSALAQTECVEAETVDADSSGAGASGSDAVSWYVVQACE